jgi:hypothetical protein
MHGSYMNMTTWDTQFHECAQTAAAAAAAPAFAISVILVLFIRYALERGAEHVAFIYDGLLLFNVSLAAFPDAKFWQVCDFCVLHGGMRRRLSGDE